MINTPIRVCREKKKFNVFIRQLKFVFLSCGCIVNALNERNTSQQVVTHAFAHTDFNIIVVPPDIFTMFLKF